MATPVLRLVLAINFFFFLHFLHMKSAIYRINHYELRKKTAIANPIKKSENVVNTENKEKK